MIKYHIIFVATQKCTQEHHTSHTSSSLSTTISLHRNEYHKKSVLLFIVTTGFRLTPNIVVSQAIREANE